MNRDLIKGIAIGAGGMLLAPVMLPVLARLARPAVGGAMRAGVWAWERGRESFAEIGEYAEDLAAEMRSGQPGTAEVPAAKPSDGHGTA